MKNMFINYDNPIQQPEEELISCNPIILSTSEKRASLLKNIKDEVIGVGVRYASNFSLEVQLNEYDKEYLENSKVIFESIPLNNKSRFIKKFETASVLDIEKNKLKLDFSKLDFSEKESAALNKLNKESYKMSIKLCRENDENDFIEIFTQNDGFLVVR